MLGGPVRLKTPDDIKRIEDSGRIIAELFQYLERDPLVSLSTWEIDTEIGNFIGRKRARSAFMTLRGYDFYSCISINEEAVHGLPSRKKRVKNGDIVKIDVGVVYNGYFSDACITIAAGQVSASGMKLIECCRSSLDEAISVMGPGVPISAIGNMIEGEAVGDGFSVIRSHAGHGVGFALHEPPVVPCYAESGQDMLMCEGMVLAVEPVLCGGSGEVVLCVNGWTTSTADGSMAAHFEHTIAIVEGGARVLTV